MNIIGRTGLQRLQKYVNYKFFVSTTRLPYSIQEMSSEPVDITAPPLAGQRISHNGKEYTTIKEGLAYILIPSSASTVPQTSPKGENEPQSVFYNPIQQFNRDLSVLAIKAYGEEALERKRYYLEKRHDNLPRRKYKKRKREGCGSDTDEQRKVSRLDTAENAENLTNNAEGTIREPETSAPLGDTVDQLEYDKSYPVEEPSSVTETEVSIAKIPTTESASNTEANNISGAAAQAESGNSRQPSFTILDALSATGLRALRYAQEIPFTTSITANDLLLTATETINMNVQHNKLTGKIKAITGNALAHMYSLAIEQTDNRKRPKHNQKYDVIDLDPYGTAAPFLDAAVQSVRDDGGLLCVTCTDAGVWASNSYPEKAYSLYGGIPIKGAHSHEGGLRLILHAISTSAARYGLAMEPLLSLSIDFYARVFVRIQKSPMDVKFLAGKTMVVYNCDSGCGAWVTQLLAKNKTVPNKSGTGTFYKHVFSLAPSTSEYCDHCGSKTHMAGPMYAGPIHSPDFIQRILDNLPNVSRDTYGTTERIEGMLNLALEETLPYRGDEDSPDPKPTTLVSEGKFDAAAVDYYPFFFIPSMVSKIIHCVTPHENALRGALKHLGYRVTRSHTKAGSIKTDAPWGVIWEVMREWTRQKAPVRERAIKEGTPGWKILELGKASKKVDSSKDGELHESTNGASGATEEPKVVFDESLGKERHGKKLVRYQINPRENWGPMNRAKRH
jgi:tRNA (guanine26-N2/guanine27-N2)-dimethyltransferase